MSVMESLVTRRTYRRFAQKPVPQDVVDDIVEAVRLSSCGANRQALRLVVVQSPEMVAKVQPLVKWAAYLPPEQGMPKADETPTLYVAVLQDSSAPGDLSTDTGIALANMTLAAWDKEVGSWREVLSGRKPRLLRAQAQRGRDRTERVSCMTETKLHIYIYFPHRSV